jgi:FHA domain
MSLFSEIEKTIERGFRHWTERVFGPAQSGELLLTHRAILEEIETQVQTISRGKRVFPFGVVTVTLTAADEARRGVVHAAFADGGRLERDIRQLLEGAGCELVEGFRVDIETAEGGDTAFDIRYAMAAPQARRVAGAVKLVVVKGKADQEEYPLRKARTNIGRMAELTDADERVVRRNDVVFEEGVDPLNASVSRKHAHIREESGEFRICDDDSEFGTRVFRDGRVVEVPKGNRRGEKLRPGDEIYLGRACLRFEEC